MNRPTSVTVIAWILIAMSAINLITSALTMNDPMVRELMAKSSVPIPVQFTMLFVGLGLTLAAGIAMLKGRNWGRWLYVMWTLFGTIVGFATSPMKAMMIPGVLIFLIIAFFLFRPKATAYFTGTHSPDEQNA